MAAVDPQDLDAAVAHAIGRLIAGGGPSAAALAVLHGAAPRPLWSQGGRPTPMAARALALLRGAEEHGLRPSAYDVAALELSAGALRSTPTPP